MKPSFFDTFVQRALERHNHYYSYPDQDIRKMRDVVQIDCPKHGRFEQKAYSHLAGFGCAKCRADRLRGTFEDFKRIAGERHQNRYAYPDQEYGGTKSSVRITCPVHGEFEQNANSHMQGAGCPRCKNAYVFSDVVQKANVVHDHAYRYPEQPYGGSRSKMTIECPVHGVFEQEVTSHLRGTRCPSCAASISRMENEVFEFCASLGQAHQRDRTIIPPLEIDIVVPDAKLGVEFTGLYWHTDDRRDQGHLYDKFRRAQEVGYHLVTIYEDEWRDHRAKVENQLRRLISKQNPTRGARDLSITKISTKCAQELYDKFHLQGGTSSTYHYGAFYGPTYNPVLAGVMSFGPTTRQSQHEWELRRFCTNGGHYPGLASKLFRAFVREHSPTSIVSFSDNRWFSGGVYRALGFEHDGDVAPDYQYVRNGVRYHKGQFKRKLIENKLGPILPGETEKLAMQRFGFSRIWDCGKTRWVWRPSSAQENFPFSS